MVDSVCGNEILFVLVFGAVFAVLQFFLHAGPSVGGAAVVLKLLSALFVFGAFVCVIAVTEETPRYAASGPRIRTICGVIAGAAIATIFSATGIGIIVVAVVGGILGYAGKLWAYYI